jgi:hypothetical protein
MHYRGCRLEVDPDRRLAHLVGGEGQGAMIYSMIEACKSKNCLMKQLQQQLYTTTAIIPVHI